MAVRLSALCVGCPLPQKDSWYTFLLEAEPHKFNNNIKIDLKETRLVYVNWIQLSSDELVSMRW
jgi:hypothetical protein